MKIADIPADEPERIKALDELNIIYSPAEERFDRITRLAKRHFKVPIVLVSLVYSEIQWFKSCQGLAASETPRDVSFCSHALLVDMPLVINDTHKNPDFADNPLVIGEPYIRFYAGKTIMFMNKKIGTLCLIDTMPRDFNSAEMDSLNSLAAWVEIELENINYSDTVKKLIQSSSQQQRKKLIDSITGCWNRRGIETILKKYYSKTDAEHPNLTLMKIGLDDTNNKSAESSMKLSETWLIEVAQRIRSVLPNVYEIAHTLDKEFLVVLEISDKATARTIAQNILRSIYVEPFQIDEVTLMSTASIGMACSEDLPNGDWQGLMQLADSALYDAQVEGGNQSVMANQADVIEAT